MSQYDLLVQALQEQQMLSQAQAGHEGVMSRFRPIEQKYEDVNTSRFKRGLMGAGEAIVDAIRRPGAQKQYYSGLEEALSSARGVDEIKAQIEMMAQVRAAEEQRAYDEQQALAKFNQQKELEGIKTQGKIEAAKARGPMVSVNNMPKPDKGYMFVDGDPMRGQMPIPGGAAERTMQSEQLSAMEPIRKGVAIFSDPNLAKILGPMDSKFNSSRRAFNTDSGRLAGNLERWAAVNIIDAASAIKGPITEKEWPRVEKTMPTMDAHPSEWVDWFVNQVVPLAKKERPELSGEIDAEVSKLTQSAGDNFGYSTPSAPSRPAQSAEPQAVNPETGEVVVYRNGQWVKK